MPVQDVYKFTNRGDDRRLVAGTVESGSARAGDEIVFYPSGKRSRIKTLEAFNRAAAAGDLRRRSRGLHASGADLRLSRRAGGAVARAAARDQLASSRQSLLARPQPSHQEEGLSAQDRLGARRRCASTKFTASSTRRTWRPPRRRTGSSGTKSPSARWPASARSRSTWPTPSRRPAASSSSMPSRSAGEASSARPCRTGRTASARRSCFASTSGNRVPSRRSAVPAASRSVQPCC